MSDKEWRIERQPAPYPDLIWDDTADGKQHLIAEVHQSGVAERIIAAIASQARLVAALEEIVDAYGYGSAPEAFCRNIHDTIMEARSLLAAARSAPEGPGGVEEDQG